ncbi:MAG: type III-B CRISPR module RAMP protein Cmr4 [Archangium sp.]
METRPYLLQALSPLHVGTGQSVGVIDLPLMRMRATGIPFVPGSSLKGVLREAHRPDVGASERDRARHATIFGPLRARQGPEGDEALEHAGALVVGDARLLALPVRSFFGTFALATSPLLLALARRDLGHLSGAEAPPALPAPMSGRAARVASLTGCANVYTHGDTSNVYLEDLDVEVGEDAAVAAWARCLARVVPEEERELLTRRLVVVDDETMSFLWETATQVDTRVRIDSKTGTVAPGQLWTEESLPAETLLLGVMAATRGMNQKEPMEAHEVLNKALVSEGGVLQLGGKATVGRGRCRLWPWPGDGR